MPLGALLIPPHSSLDFSFLECVFMLQILGRHLLLLGCFPALLQAFKFHYRYITPFFSINLYTINIFYTLTSVYDTISSFFPTPQEPCGSAPHPLLLAQGLSSGVLGHDPVSPLGWPPIHLRELVHRRSSVLFWSTQVVMGTCLM